MSDSLRDFGRTLRLNFAATDLAVHLHTARCTAFGVPRPWSDLDPATRRLYVTRATELLLTLQPAPFAGLPKVVGQITTEYPYGITPDARD